MRQQRDKDRYSRSGRLPECESVLGSEMSRICSVLNADEAILWKLQRGNELVWLASLGIREEEFGCDSRFAEDVLLNVIEAQRGNKARSFLPAVHLLHEDTPGSHQSTSNSVAQHLVMTKQQWMLPFKNAAGSFVLNLFCSDRSQPEMVVHQRRVERLRRRLAELLDCEANLSS